MTLQFKSLSNRELARFAEDSDDPLTRELGHRLERVADLLEDAQPEPEEIDS